MAQHPFGNDPAKIARYRSFWRRESVSRPLVGFSLKSWFPLQEFAASAAWQEHDVLTPEMVSPEAFLEDQDRLLREGETLDDDILRGASPSQAVPWLDGMLGCRLRILPASILGEERRLSWDEAEGIALDTENPWYRLYMASLDTLAAHAAGRYPVSHGTLVGPSDMAAVLRGHGQHVLDLVYEPERAAGLLWRMAEIFCRITTDAWERLPLYGGGYYDAQYQLWAPGPIIRMQEDASALYAPDLYRRYLEPVDRMVADRFPCAFMHLHSTSMHLLDAFLGIETLGCYEVNYEVISGGPPMREMVRYYRRFQEADKSLLIRGSFTPDEVRLMMDTLEPRGLYLYIMVESNAEVDALRPLVGM